jgi:hypothetical protein
MLAARRHLTISTRALRGMGINITATDGLLYLQQVFSLAAPSYWSRLLTLHYNKVGK